MEPSLFCPACDSEQLETRAERLEIPHFDEVLQLTYLCQDCGFRRSDLTITKQEEPARYRLEVTDEDDLATRVVRSASGHFEIPELDVRAEPARAADAFVTNAEGMLDRCRDAIQTAMSGTDDEAKLERGEELLDRAERMRAVEETWTLVIEDPRGNSAILTDDAERTELTKEQVEELSIPDPVNADVDDAVER